MTTHALPRTGATPPAPGSDRRWALPAWWPLGLVCLGFPLWWIVGWTTLILPAAAVAMAWQLRGRSPAAPRGFGVWLLFLAVMLLSGSTLWADAPGAQPGGGPGRLLSYGTVVAYYLTATAAMLWVGNSSEEQVPARTVFRLVGWLFVVSVLGGWLGLLAPHAHLHSITESLLPHRLATNAFVREMVHPVTAQVQDVLGYDEARPAAPYAFTNAWGANTTLYLPFFVVGWLAGDAGWRRPVGIGVLLLAIAPVVESLNRGMWLGIATMGLLLAVRLAFAGRTAALLGVVALGVAVLATAALTPLGGVVKDRLDHGHSNDRRAGLADKTLHSAMSSPVVGFGTTRPVQGNFSSIAGGATPQCPKCQPPPFGTHGHLYRLVFTEGLLGAACYLAFMLRRLGRHARSMDRYVVAATLSTTISLLFLLYYNMLPHALFVVMIGLGLAWRREREGAAGPGTAAGAGGAA